MSLLNVPSVVRVGGGGPRHGPSYHYESSDEDEEPPKDVFDRLFKELVPRQGPPDTEDGSLLLAINNIARDLSVNGGDNMYWDPGHPDESYINEVYRKYVSLVSGYATELAPFMPDDLSVDDVMYHVDEYMECSVKGNDRTEAGLKLYDQVCDETEKTAYAVALYIDSKRMPLAILYASKNGHADVVQRLLEQGDPGKYGVASIYQAVIKGHTEVLRLLLADGRADPGRYGIDALYDAVQEGRTELVRLLLADGRVDPEGSALVAAAVRKHIDVVRLLLADGRSDPNHAVEVVAMMHSDPPARALMRLLLADGRVKHASVDKAITEATNKRKSIMVRLLRAWKDEHVHAASP